MSTLGPVRNGLYLLLCNRQEVYVEQQKVQLSHWVLVTFSHMHPSLIHYCSEEVIRATGAMFTAGIVCETVKLKFHGHYLSWNETEFMFLGN